MLHRSALASKGLPVAVPASVPGVVSLPARGIQLRTCASKSPVVADAADSGSSALPARPIVFMSSVSTIEKPATETSTATSTSEAASTSAPGKVGSSKWVIDGNEELKSNNMHRFWTFGSMALMAGIEAQALGQVHDESSAVTAVAAFVAAYVLSDLGTGIYHWSVDNYGDGNTPLVGKQIAAFQGHHQRPWTITKREFCNNVHQVFLPAAFPSALFCVTASTLPLGWNAFIGPFMFMVCMSQQFHAWSHMKKSELPGYIIALQEAGILISRKAHGAHHKSPFEGNYCIVSGLWNDVLDNSGFFRNLEKFVHSVNGVEPRCWHEPEYGWEPQEEPSG